MEQKRKKENKMFLLLFKRVFEFLFLVFLIAGMVVCFIGGVYASHDYLKGSILGMIFLIALIFYIWVKIKL
jgi:uncharacterized membrane protein YqjE